MLEHATETITEASEAMDDIGTIAALAQGGTMAQVARALARIVEITDTIAHPLSDLSREMVDIEKGRM